MWYACCQCVVPACPEMAVSESVPSRHTWQCDDCVVSRSDISVGTRVMWLWQKQPWWSMTVPPLQGQGHLRPYISSDRGEIVSFSTPAWFVIMKTSHVSNFSCPPNPTRGTSLPGRHTSPPLLPTSAITIGWWRLTITGNRLNEWKMCIESPRLPGHGLPWKRNGGRPWSDRGSILISRMMLGHLLVPLLRVVRGALRGVSVP